MTFENEVLCYKYLVLGENGYCNVFKSLRLISNEISIDYSTISKKLKLANTCFCICKETKEKYYINKLM